MKFITRATVPQGEPARKKGGRWVLKSMLVGSSEATVKKSKVSLGLEKEV